MAINGWTPDTFLPCYGFPGDIFPFVFFDSLGFTYGMDLGGEKVTGIINNAWSSCYDGDKSLLLGALLCFKDDAK